MGEFDDPASKVKIDTLSKKLIKEVTGSSHTYLLHQWCAGTSSNKDEIIPITS